RIRTGSHLFLHPVRNLLVGEPRIELGLPAPKAGVLPLYDSPIIFLTGQETGMLTITLRPASVLCPIIALCGIIDKRHDYGH
ncbi:MAG: hypothetical protein UX56_C0041G0010, partial [Candidatus Azambacteria bacterium GW2011_GWD2_46_48]